MPPPLRIPGGDRLPGRWMAWESLLMVEGPGSAVRSMARGDGVLLVCARGGATPARHTIARRKRRRQARRKKRWLILWSTGQCTSRRAHPVLTWMTLLVQCTTVKTLLRCPGKGLPLCGAASVDVRPPSFLMSLPSSPCSQGAPDL